MVVFVTVPEATAGVYVDIGLLEDEGKAGAAAVFFAIAPPVFESGCDDPESLQRPKVAVDSAELGSETPAG